MSNLREVQVLGQDASRCMRHYQRLVPEAEGAVGECVPDTLLGKRDQAERFKGSYENLETVFVHFEKVFQAFCEAYRKLERDPTPDTVSLYDALSDFSLEAPRTMNALRVRITRLDQEIQEEVMGSLDGSHAGSGRVGAPSDRGFLTAPRRPCGSPSMRKIAVEPSPTVWLNTGRAAGGTAQSTSPPSVQTALSDAGDRVVPSDRISACSERDDGHAYYDDEWDPERRGATSRDGAAAREQQSASDINIGQLVTMLADAINGNRNRGQTHNNPKLPVQKITEFSGHYNEFQPWWDNFERLVDQNPTLAKAQKLSYLVTNLSGEAEMLVKHLRITNDNYDTAVALLKDAFGNKVIAVETLESKIYDIKPVTRYDAAKLKSFYYEVENFVGSLKALGADVERFVGLLIKKLPVSFVTNLERSKGVSQEWTMDLLRKTMKLEIEIREAAVRRANRSQTGDDDKPSRYHKGASGHQRAAVELVTSDTALAGPDVNQGKALGARRRETRSQAAPSANRWTDPPKTRCIYCDAQHWSSDCDKYKTTQSRQTFILEQGRCFICLRKGHVARDCPSDSRCCHCKAVKAHHSSICREKFGNAAKRNGRRFEQARLADEHNNDKLHDLTVKGEQSNLADDEHTMMKTALMSVRNTDEPGNSMTIRGFFDTGTSRSFITERMAKRLKLPIETERVLSIKRFSRQGEPPLIDVVKTTRLDLLDTNGERWRIKVSVSKNTMERMTKAAIPMDMRRRFPPGIRLADEQLKAHEVVPVDFMVGNDYYDELITGRKLSLGNGFYLIESVFGWMPSGRLPDEDCCGETRDAISNLIIDDPVRRFSCDESEQVENYWKLEAISINDEPNPVSDDWAMQRFNETVKFEEGRYQVCWPFNDNVQRLPTNYALALRRLQSFLARQKRANRWDFLEKYDAIMRDQLAKGVLEPSPRDESGDSVIHFLAHHGVETPHKDTTKLRVVYDASAREGPTSPSLNECLFRGEVILDSIPALLCRLRLGQIAIVSDIEKAFLQVGLQESQRNACQLIWVKDIRKSPDRENLIAYRFRRIPFGVKTSPFLLGAVILHHLKQESSEIASKIANHLYVDNVVLTVDSDEAATKFYHESKAIFKRAGMNLREYSSNSEKLMAEIPDQDRVKDPVMKILGLTWDRRSDNLSLSGPSLTDDTVTKRVMLSQLYKTFDPLGFAAPVVVQGKILLQKVMKRSRSWSEPVGIETEAEWKRISSDLSRLAEIVVPRFIGGATRQPARLVAFCDASKAAYAAVVYVQFGPDELGQFTSDVIMAKSRVAPIKEMSIPRLELMAMVIAIRLVEFLRKNLPYDGETIVLTDSQCLLYWISSTRVQTKFVENRLREIRKAANVKYRHVPTKDNPADLASRGVSIDGLGALWWHGPTWCHLTEDNWPPTCVCGERLKESDDRGTFPEQAKLVQEEICKTSLFELSRFSSFKRLVRVVAWTLRFVRNMKEKVKRGRAVTIESITPPLQPFETKAAEVHLVKRCQYEHLSDLIGAVKNRKEHPLKSSLGVQMGQCGLLRCHGRLSNIVADDRAKYPILLPSKSQLTELVIRHHHASNLHAGAEQTLASVRKEFWIPKGRSRVKAVLRNCTLCRKQDGGMFKRPPMPDLPAIRVRRSPPFDNVGMDNFGPVLTKKHRGEVSKRWVTMFTCLAVRAIHLEIINDQSAEECVMAMRRFIARRGKPRAIVCDNASQFRAVGSGDPFSHFLSGQQIEWHFIPQLTPWAGGVYERLIKVTKSAFRKAVGRSLLTDTELATVLAEVEMVVNSRPITRVSDDVNDPQALTPNDFLGLRTVSAKTTLDEELIDRAYEPSQSTAEQLRSSYKRRTKLVESFWHCWSSQYLQGLRERMTWLHRDAKGSVTGRPVMGQVVLVREPLLPRSRWRYGIVTQCLTGKDGKIRAVRLKSQAGHELTRPVNMICPLECPESVSSGGGSEGLEGPKFGVLADTENTGNREERKGDGSPRGSRVTPVVPVTWASGSRRQDQGTGSSAPFKDVQKVQRHTRVAAEAARSKIKAIVNLENVSD